MTPEQDLLTGVLSRGAVSQRYPTCSGGEKACRMPGKEIHQPFIILKCGNASSVSFTAHAIIGHYWKILSCLSWKEPVEKTLEATENLKVNISFLFFLRVRQSP